MRDFHIGMGSIIALAGLGMFAGGVRAEVIATIGFTELNGSYNSLDLDGSGNPLYRCAAVSQGSLDTRGDVTRLSGAAGTATFDTGYTAATAGNYVAAVSVIGFGNSRPGVGSFTVTDLDGDTITAEISGTWTPGPGSTGIIFFNGSLSDVRFLSNGDGINDGTYDGTSGTGFSYTDLTASYTGAIVQLSTRPGVGFFQSNFSNVSTLVNANIVPAPASALALSLGLVGLRRRR